MGAFTRDDVRRFTPPFWFPLSHGEAIEAVDGVVLTALCDASQDALDRAQTRFPEARTFLDAAAMFAETRPELVAIATRTPGRAALIEQAIHAGASALHVEKPLCSSVAELLRLEQLLQQQGIFVTLGAVRRFLAPYREAVKLANSGELGALVEIRINMWAGTLYWAHPHSIDLALFAAGDRKVKNVQARLSTLQYAEHAPWVVENDPAVHAATLWFDDGVAAHISRGPGSEFVLFCEKGIINVQNNGAQIIVARQIGDDPNFHYAPHPFNDCGGYGGTALPIAQLVRCLDGDADARAQNNLIKEQILAGQRVLFAMVASYQQSGSAISLDDLDPSIEILGITGGMPA